MAGRHAKPQPGVRVALGSATTLAVLSVPATASASSHGNSNGKQTICHATNSNTNPYVVITPNKNGVVDGHAGHTGPIWNPTLKSQHIQWGDIIPPFSYNDHGTPASFPGQNWTATGQAWFANGCKAPAPTGGSTGGTTGGTTGTTTGSTTGSTTGTTTGSTTGSTTGGSTAGGSTSGGTTGATSGITTGPVSTTTGTFTGGGGHVPKTLPMTGAFTDDQMKYGGALLLAGLGAMLLTPRRRRAIGRHALGMMTPVPAQLNLRLVPVASPRRTLVLPLVSL